MLEPDTIFIGKGSVLSYKSITLQFSPNRPTGPIRFSSCDVRVPVCVLSPSHVILPGEQRRSQRSKAVLHRSISTLKKMYIKKCPSLQLAGLHKASILCILDTRQVNPHKTAGIQKIGISSWAELN